MRAKSFCFSCEESRILGQPLRFQARSICCKLVAVVNAAVLSVLLLAAMPAENARAQERVSRTPSILEFLGFKRPAVKKPAAVTHKRKKRPVVVKGPRRQIQKTVRRANVRGNAATAPNQVATYPAVEPSAPVEKIDTAKPVLIIGDFMAGALAEGLIEAFADSPGVKVVEKWNGSSGFARKDYYDWPSNLPAIMAAVKPSVVLMMIGANDRQQIQVGDKYELVGTLAWTTEYELRVKAMAQTLKSAGVPSIWVGQPAFRSSQMSRSMTAFNDIYRRNIESVGGTFVDIWDGFVDENGAFQQSGPDMNGLPARLRASDGISFAAAGKRKAAFFVEKPLRQLLGETAALSAAELPHISASGFIGPMLPAPVIITRTEPMSLDDPEMDGSSALLGENPKPLNASAGGSVQNLLLTKGFSPRPQSGRVDDFRVKQPIEPKKQSASSLTLDGSGASK